MNCHGCARTRTERIPVSIWRCCSVAPCNHPVAAFQARTVPQVMLFLVWAAMRLRPRLLPDREATGRTPSLEAAHAH